jgi:23S rRNA pseudouridine1911/1915/1917 synthase
MTDAQWTIGPDDVGVRLDKFLAAADRLGSRGRAVAALQRGKVFRNGAEVGASRAAAPLAAGDLIRVWMDRPGSATRRPRPAAPGDLGLVFEDESLLVLNKPAGLLAVPLEERGGAPSAYDWVREHLRSRGKQRPFVVHRIDRDTSGLVVFARNARAQRLLKDQFKQREPERIYQAVVYGHPDPREGTWRDRLAWHRAALIQKPAHPRDSRAKEAISSYRVIETFRGASLVEVRLQTGKQNQIRIQAQLHGHGLVGERRYVDATGPSGPIRFPRQALHAHRLAFRHPANGRPLRFEAPLPDDLIDLIARLRRR